MYLKHKMSQFETRGDVLPAWLQNLLGNMITLNAI
jgi:hypothetical protein